MELYGDKSSTIENRTLSVIGSTWMGKTTSPREVVVAPLNLDNKCPEFSRLDGE